jgi:hypothetical protein
MYEKRKRRDTKYSYVRRENSLNTKNKMKGKHNDKKGESGTLDTVVWKGGMVGQKGARRIRRGAKKNADVRKYLTEKESAGERKQT